LQQSIVEEDAAFLTEELLASLFNAHGQALLIANLDNVRFLQRLIDEFHLPFDFCLVDFDHQSAKQLVEVEIYDVFLDVAYYDAEVH